MRPSRVQSPTLIFEGSAGGTWHPAGSKKGSGVGEGTGVAVGMGVVVLVGAGVADRVGTSVGVFTGESAFAVAVRVGVAGTGETDWQPARAMESTHR